MTGSGDFKPGRSSVRLTGGEAGSAPQDSCQRGSQAISMPRRVMLALGMAVLAALAWAVLRGILDLSVGLLVVAGAGGWGIGAALRELPRGRLLGASLGLAAWLSSLLLTWLVTRLVLPGSSLGFTERLAQTGFLDYTLQQAGALELASLALFAGGALFSGSAARGRRPG